MRLYAPKSEALTGKWVAQPVVKTQGLSSLPAQCHQIASTDVWYSHNVRMSLLGAFEASLPALTRSGYGEVVTPGSSFRS
jgi:hypothetical protein